MRRCKLLRSRLAAVLLPVGLATTFLRPEIAQADCIESNTCYGVDALLSVTTGTSNSAFGYQALRESVEGRDNSAFGAYALSANTSGELNTALGASALQDMTTGSRNTGVGVNALEATDDGSNNTAIGFAAMGSPFGDPHSVESNTAVGSLSMTIYSGAENTATGFRAMGAHREGGVEGSSNTANGAWSMGTLKSGTWNTAMGAYSLFGDSSSAGVTGNYNLALGANAMRNTKGGDYSVAVGFSSLRSNFNGFRNTAVGSQALGNLTSGARNVAVGGRAGENILTGKDNITIGTFAFGDVTDTGVIRLGTSQYQRKTFIAGIRGVQTGSSGAVPVVIDANGQLGTINSSAAAKENIHAMGRVSERLLSLRPVTFQYKQPDSDGSKPIQFGLIAEEVAETFPELVVYNAEGKPETVSYHLLATLLVNEFQKEHAMVEAQAKRIGELEKTGREISELRAQVLQMATALKTLQRDQLGR